MSKDLASPVLTKTVITAGEVQYFVEGGLTKREIFAMHAMQGFISHYGLRQDSFDSLAAKSRVMAEALLEDLEKCSPLK